MKVIPGEYGTTIVNETYEPKPRDYDFKLNRKVKELAKMSALSYKAKGNAIVVVEDINMVKKHRKPTQNTPGGISDIPAAIHMSNVMLIDPKSGEPTRIGRKEVNGKTVRYSKKSGEIIK